MRQKDTILLPQQQQWISDCSWLKVDCSLSRTQMTELFNITKFEKNITLDSSLMTIDCPKQSFNIRGWKEKLKHGYIRPHCPGDWIWFLYANHFFVEANSYVTHLTKTRIKSIYLYFQWYVSLERDSPLKWHKLDSSITF